MSITVNDMHSGLNETTMAGVLTPRSSDDVRDAILTAREAGASLSVCAGRHAMGGQQFAEDGLLLDMSGIAAVVAFDRERGQIEVEAGIEWPALVSYLVDAQRDTPLEQTVWGIAQKQSGADNLSIGGALSANVHGRGLRMAPFVADIEAFTLIDAAGDLHRCSRSENSELFALAVGGYGLFGVICTLTLRLARRRKLRRVVEIIDVADVMTRLEERIASGYLYGDFQYATDSNSGDFLRRGVFSCYEPVSDDTPIDEEAGAATRFTREKWLDLMHLAHTDKTKAFEQYSAYYLSTHGRIMWSDIHQMGQLGGYVEGYHAELDQRLRTENAGSEMITEIFVPRDRLVELFDEVRANLRRVGADVIYGTVRLIERDDDSFLRWAKQPYAGVIFNLHVTHTPEGVAGATETFRELIDSAIARDGRYYLTYHRWATKRQIVACYPEFESFLRHKLRYDPEERFQSNWYRHHKALFATP